MIIQLLLSLIFAICLFLLKRGTRKPRKYPPGPLFLPSIGSIYTVPGQGVHHRIERWRQKYGNIIGHKYGPSYEIYVTGLEESIAALKHPNFQGRKVFQHRNKGIKRGLFFNDGPSWAILKRFTLNYFSEYQKNKIEELVVPQMNFVLPKIKTDTETEISYKFFDITLNILMKIIGSVDHAENQPLFDRIFTHLYRSLHETRPTGIEIYYPSLRRFMTKDDNSLRFVHEFFKERIREHRATLNKNNPRDFVDAFLVEQNARANEDNIFCDEELIVDWYDLIRAGSISPADATMLVVLYLLLYPEVQKKMQAEIDQNVGQERMPGLDDRKKLPYCEAVIAESLRINPIVPLIAPHRVTDDTEFYGYIIPKNAILKVSLFHLFRDPKLWKDPDVFKPERFVENGEFVKYPHHLPFGFGKRSCLMEAMARNIMFLFLTTLFQKYSVVQPPGCPRPSTKLIDGSVAGPRPFKVIFKRRFQD